MTQHTPSTSVIPLDYGGGPNGQKYYSHSGAISPVGVMLGLLGGFIAAVVGGFVYAYTDRYIPLIYLNCFGTCLFGAWLGYVPTVSMQAGHMRNSTAYAVGAVLTIVAGYYVSWVVWIGSYATGIPLIKLALAPRALWLLIEMLNESGTWSLGPVGGGSNGMWSGIPLTIVWILEAAIILIAGLLVSRKVGKKRMFCESCGRWASKSRVIAQTDVTPTSELRRWLEAGQLENYAELRQLPVNSVRRLDWTLMQCPSCQRFAGLSVAEATVTYQKGKARTNIRVIVDKLLISPEAIQKIIAPPPPPATGAPVPLSPVSPSTSLPPFAEAAADSTSPPAQPSAGEPSKKPSGDSILDI